MSKDGESGSALGQVVVLRLFRLFRLARIFRLFRFLRELWVMMSSLAISIRTVSWASIFIFAFIYCGAILATQLVGESCARDNRCDELPFPEDKLQK